MDVYTLMNNLVTAVAADTTLKTWSQANYGQDHNVFIDQDDREPPGESSAPDVQFHSPSKNADEEVRIVDYTIGLFIVLYDAAEATRAEDNVAEYSATQNLVTFIDRILVVIRETMPAGWVMAYDYITDTISAFPNFEADVAVMFRQRILIGQDPLG